jgi:hypothetical protein
MKQIVFKSILAGAALGAVWFLFAFLFKFLLVALIVGGLFRFFAKRRQFYHQQYAFGFRPQWADRIRSMSDEEYQDFRQSAYHIPTL